MEWTEKLTRRGRPRASLMVSGMVIAFVSQIGLLLGIALVSAGSLLAFGSMSGLV